MFQSIFHHEHHPGHHCRGRHGGFGRGPMGRGFGGGGRERLFDAGELKLVILHLLAEKPSYGYELIKAIEERLSGGYAPSPGVIYPTLTLLEEEGLTTPAISDTGKKVYALTDAGQMFLKENQRRIQDLLERLDQTGETFERGRTPQLMRAFMNLRGAVKARVSRRALTPEQLAKIAEAIDAAARTIDEM